MPAFQPEPLLQILHYSDIHLAVQGSMYKRWQTSRMPLSFRQGLAGARRALLHEFIHLIRDLSSGDNDWKNHPIWLVDTGDGTTFGETDALREWDDWTRKFEQATPGAQLLRVYGNHDAWPQGHPLKMAHAPWQMDTQRDILRNTHFPQTWPTAPLSIPIPNTSCHIELCLVNTVDHRLWPNVFALGIAARDRDWTHFQKIPRPTPANDLADRARKNGAAVHRDLRIAAMHYPVADDATLGNPSLQKVLKNRKRFAKELRQHPIAQPLITHLLLAGHTHEVFPKLGQLPATATVACHAPLTNGQCQIVTGSLSQEALPRTALPAAANLHDKMMHSNPYQCTLLRFFIQANSPYELLMDRATIAADDSGIFSYLPTHHSPQGYTTPFERMKIVL